MTSRDALRLAVFTAATAGLIIVADEPWDEEYAQEGHSGFYLAHELAEIGQFYDEVSPVTFMAGLCATTLAGGLVFNDKKLLTTTRLMVESALITELITFVVKGALGRSRPYTNEGATAFHPFIFSGNEDFKSMLSGHVSSIFSVVTVAAQQYDRWWVQLPADTFATAVAFQRMESRQHWLSDTVVGAALGYSVGRLLTRRQTTESQGASLYPYIRGKRIGISMRF